MCVLLSPTHRSRRAPPPPRVFDFKVDGSLTPHTHIHACRSHSVCAQGGATFLSVDASVIENKWLGESEKNARAVFTLARRLAPCVIYLDEVRNCHM